MTNILNTKLFIFIDGDNIGESYIGKIIEEAKKLGEVYEVHCFCDFVKKKETWEEAYYEYGVQLHYIPGRSKRKGNGKKSVDPNTSDIALSIFAAKKFISNPEVDGCIIVANDKDYVPLAKEIREGFHKKAYMFYNEQDDKAVVSYDGAVLLNAAQTKDKAEAQAKTAASKKAKSEQQIIKDCIEKELGDGNETLLSSLGPKLKEDGIIYPTGVGELGKYLKEKFDKYPKLFNVYELILGDKRDRVVRKTK